MKPIAWENRNLNSENVLLEDFSAFSKSFFKINTFTLSTVSKGKSRTENIKILLSDGFFWFSTINVCLFVAFSAVNALQESLNMVALTFSLPLLSSLSLVVVKCSTVYFNKSNIVDLLDRIKQVFPKDEKDQRKYEIKSYYKSYLRFARIYAFLFMVPCFCVMTIPLISLISTGQRALPLNIWLPFEHEKSNAVYLIVYLWTIWTCSNSVLLLIAVDTFMFVLITLVSMELDILKADLINLRNAWNSKIDRQIAELIKRHNELFECGKMLENIFSPSFLYNFLQGSFVICLTAFQYSTSADTIQRIFNGSYCAAILNQTLLLCYFGQKVIDASENIAGGAYDCGWHEIENMKVRKAVKRIIERAQRPTKLTGMNFTDISLLTFTSVRKYS